MRTLCQGCGRVTLSFAAIAISVVGCGRPNKVQQIERGIENVKVHAEKIEDEVQSLDPNNNRN